MDKMKVVAGLAGLAIAGYTLANITRYICLTKVAIEAHKMDPSKPLEFKL